MTKPLVTVRAATLSDISNLSFLWHEKMVLYQQMDRRFRLLPDARERWEATATSWLGDDIHCTLIAEIPGEMIGFIVGLIDDSSPELMPEKIGRITDLVIDVHSYQRGVGRILLDEIRIWFEAHGMEQVVAQLYYRLAVEQAFWRAQGATEWIDLMWLK